MTKLSTAIIVAIFIVVLLGVNGEEKARNKRQTITVLTGNSALEWLCQNMGFILYFLVQHYYYYYNSKTVDNKRHWWLDN
jgi:hypothetical protein